MKKEKKIRFLLTGEQWLGVGILAVLVGATLFLVHRFQPAEPEVVEVVNDSVLTQFATYQAEQDSIRKATWKKKYFLLLLHNL